MKLKIALAITLAAASGAALAQDAGVGASPPPALSFTIPDLDEYARGETTAASREVHKACAVDMHVLCAGKAGPAADRCLVYHRLSFSAGCRRAITGFERAAAPIGQYDTLADYRPYSRVQTRTRAPAKGWRPVPTGSQTGAASGA